VRVGICRSPMTRTRTMLEEMCRGSVAGEGGGQWVSRCAVICLLNRGLKV
jgi:hypothetical protein